MRNWRHTGGWLVLLLTVLTFAGYRYIRFALSTPANINLAAMPEEEFAQNDSLFLEELGEELLYTVSTEHKEDVLALLKGYASPDYLLWEVQVTRSAGNRSRSQFGTYLKQGADYDVEVREGGTLLRSVRMRGGSLTVSSGGISRSGMAQDVYTPLAVLGMAEIATLANLDPQHVLEARFEQLNQREVLYVEFTYPDLKADERYWVSLELGLPLKVETRLDGALVYSAVTTAISDTPPREPAEPED